MLATGNAPVWFITGCSSGLGCELARKALSIGARVALTSRDVTKLPPDLNGGMPNILPISIPDLSDETRIANAISKTMKQFGRLDTLVNNAAYGYLAAIEEGSDKEVRDLFDVNFFGYLNTIKAAVPYMRAAGHGTIVNISSIAGLVGIMGFGYYSATKFAVEGLTEALHDELLPLGVRTILVELGGMQTRFCDEARDRQATTEIESYTTTAGKTRRIITENPKGMDSASAAAAKIVELVLSDVPPNRVVLGSQCRIFLEKKIKAIQSSMDNLISLND